MPKTRKTTVSADEIAEKASRGEDISAHRSRPRGEQLLDARQSSPYRRSGQEPDLLVTH
jgi:hypothetical protein